MAQQAVLNDSSNSVSQENGKVRSQQHGNRGSSGGTPGQRAGPNVLEEQFIKAHPIEVIDLIRDISTWQDWNSACKRRPGTLVWPPRSGIMLTPTPPDGFLRRGRECNMLNKGSKANININASESSGSKPSSDWTSIQVTALEEPRFSKPGNTIKETALPSYRLAFKTTGWENKFVRVTRDMRFDMVPYRGTCGTGFTRYTCVETHEKRWASYVTPRKLREKIREPEYTFGKWGADLKCRAESDFWNPTLNPRPSFADDEEQVKRNEKALKQNKCCDCRGIMHHQGKERSCRCPGRRNPAVDPRQEEEITGPTIADIGTNDPEAALGTDPDLDLYSHGVLWPTTWMNYVTSWLRTTGGQYPSSPDQPKTPPPDAPSDSDKSLEANAMTAEATNGRTESNRSIWRHLLRRPNKSAQNEAAATPEESMVPPSSGMDPNGNVEAAAAPVPASHSQEALPNIEPEVANMETAIDRHGANIGAVNLELTADDNEAASTNAEETAVDRGPYPLPKPQISMDCRMS